MRKDATKERVTDIRNVNGYHRGDGDYEKKRIFASDRPADATDGYTLQDGSIPAMYGLEIETQCWGVTNQTIYANLLSSICLKDFHYDLWKLEDDASLRGDCDSRAEIISQPMSRAFIRNNYRNFKSMYTYFKAFGVNNDLTGDCGQHCHISLTCFGRSKKAQDEAIRKLYYIVNKHFDLCRALLYRRGDTHYCSRMDYSKAWTLNLDGQYSSHGVCFNLGHYGDGNVELRLPGGQKDYPCFRNTMESIFHLVDAVKVISRKDCDDIVKIFSGCNQHVFDRLKSYCFDAGAITREQLDAIKSTVKPADFR